MLIAMIGTWKAGAVYVPIFTGFGPDAIEYRVAPQRGPRPGHAPGARAPRFPSPLPDGVHGHHGGGRRPGGAGRHELRARHGSASRTVADPVAVPARRSGGAPLHLGLDRPTEGREDRGELPAGDPPAPASTALDLRPDDVFWPTGDPGWGYGLVCYMGALALGVPWSLTRRRPTPELCLARLRERRRDQPRDDPDAAARRDGARRRGGAAVSVRVRAASAAASR